MKNNENFRNNFISILHDKFINSYPDTFIKSQTTDSIIYKQANGCMYNWYILLLNKISIYCLSPEYSQTEEEFYNSDWSCVDRFLTDFENCENWQSFLIKNTQI